MSPDRLKHLAPISGVECNHVVSELLPSPGIGLLIRVGQDEAWLLRARVRLDAGPVRPVLDLDRAFYGLEERSVRALLLAKSTAAAPVGVMMSRNLSTPRSSARVCAVENRDLELEHRQNQPDRADVSRDGRSSRRRKIVQLLYGLVPVRDDVARVDCTSSV